MYQQVSALQEYIQELRVRGYSDAPMEFVLMLHFLEAETTVPETDLALVPDPVVDTQERKAQAQQISESHNWPELPARIYDFELPQPDYDYLYPMLNQLDNVSWQVLYYIYLLWRHSGYIESDLQTYNESLRDLSQDEPSLFLYDLTEQVLAQHESKVQIDNIREVIHNMYCLRFLTRFFPLLEEAKVLRASPLKLKK